LILTVVSIYLLSSKNIPGLDLTNDAELNSICVIAITYVGFIILVNICRPFNGLRTAILVVAGLCITLAFSIPEISTLLGVSKQFKDLETLRNATYDELIELFRDCMFTRIPVYEDDKDNIIGLVNIKDFILVTDHEHFRISDIMREAHYTYEYKKTADLMLEMREKTTNVAFVLNEYGATVGMITLEDLLEEIVGEIRDEYDEDEKEFIQEVGERQYLLEGSMKLDDINNALHTDLESEDYDSIGGIIIECIDRLPVDNEEVTLEDGTTLQVQGIDQNRIVKVLMTLPEEKVEETDESSEEKSEDSETVEE
jgi:Mg2+/Co2+ transporter CorC